MPFAPDTNNVQRFSPTPIAGDAGAAIDSSFGAISTAITALNTAIATAQSLLTSLQGTVTTQGTSLTAHEAATGTAVHGLGSAATHAATDFDPAGSATTAAAGKATKIVPAAAGNVATLTAGGDLADGLVNMASKANASTVTGIQNTIATYGTAATHAATDFDSAGAASTVNSALTTHEAATGTAVHGLGTAATHAATDFDAAGAASTVNSALTTHEAATAAHGVSGALVGTTDAQTLSYKTISGSSNQILNIPESAVVNLTTDLAAKATTSALTTHTADQAAHGATSANTAGKIVARSSGGGINVGGVVVESGNTLVLNDSINGTTLTQFVDSTPWGRIETNSSCYGLNHNTAYSGGRYLYRVGGTQVAEINSGGLDMGAKAISNLGSLTLSGGSINNNYGYLSMYGAPYIEFRYATINANNSLLNLGGASISIPSGITIGSSSDTINLNGSTVSNVGSISLNSGTITNTYGTLTMYGSNMDFRYCGITANNSAIYLGGSNVYIPGGLTIGSSSDTINLNGSTVNMSGGRLTGYTGTQYASNAAAVTAGLATGTIYSDTSGNLKVVI